MLVTKAWHHPTLCAPRIKPKLCQNEPSRSSHSRKKRADGQAGKSGQDHPVGSTSPVTGGLGGQTQLLPTEDTRVFNVHLYLELDSSSSCPTGLYLQGKGKLVGFLLLGWHESDLECFTDLKTSQLVVLSLRGHGDMV